MATPYMILTLPTVGPSGTQGPEWATEINSALSAIDGHDHSSGKGKLVTPSGLNINQTLSLNSNQLSSIASLALNNLTSQPTNSNLIYEFGGELFFNDASGNQVQLTSGGAINVASLGTITGDYSTSSADLTYSDITKTYLFKQNATTTANLSTGPISIFDNSSGSKYAKLKIDSSQSANIEWTLPIALPSTSLPLKSDAVGTMFYEIIKTADIEDQAITSAKIADGNVGNYQIQGGSISNFHISPTAAIQYYKLNLSMSINDLDVADGAAIQKHKLSSYDGISTSFTSTAVVIGTTSPFTPALTISGLSNWPIDGLHFLQGLSGVSSYFYLTNSSGAAKTCTGILVYTFSSGLSFLTGVHNFSAYIENGGSARFDPSMISVFKYGTISATSGTVTLSVSSVTSGCSFYANNIGFKLYQYV